MTQVPTHFYVLVRTDLPLPQQLVQAVHASHEAGKLHAQGNPYDDRIFSVVVCQVPSEYHLMKAYDRIKNRGIEVSLFREPDIDNQATALATEPVSDRKFFSKFKLWRQRREAVEVLPVGFVDPD